LKIKLTEATVMVVVLAMLFWLAKGVYWPGRPSSPIAIVAGAFWLTIMFYGVWGYIVTSALTFWMSGAASSRNSTWLSVASSFNFAVHSFVLITLFHLKLGILSWAIWCLFVLLNLSLPFLIRGNGGHIHRVEQ
jgi:hypothetical protein